MTGCNSQGRRAGRRAAPAAAWCLAAAVRRGHRGFLAACGGGAQSGPVDLLVTGGRVMDPESGLDAVANVAVRDGVIVAVGDERPEAREVLDATGLVVAPGFVDLHAHGQDPESRRYQARDGVTTAMELEIGVYPVDAWYAENEGRALINYGATVSHQGARREAFGAVVTARNDEGTFTLGRGGAYLYEEGLRGGGAPGGPPDAGGARPGRPRLRVRHRLHAGGEPRGGSGACSRRRRSAGRPCSSTSGRPARSRSREAIAPFQEVIANAAATGAALHVVHMNSSAGESAPAALELMRGARARGVDVTTEAYPYTASASLIESALFDGWRGRPPGYYARLQWVETGERLTEESFGRYREQGGWVITHGRSETTNEWIVAQPDVIAASDGIPFTEGRSHPRGAGTFARILGHYARDRGVLSLMEALRKMTLLPAQRLEQVTPQMAAKGRVQAGADADLTLFDPKTVIDRATYDAPDRYSEGIRHVLVGGTFVVREGELDLSGPADSRVGERGGRAVGGHRFPDSGAEDDSSPPGCRTGWCGSASKGENGGTEWSPPIAWSAGQPDSIAVETRTARSVPGRPVGGCRSFAEAGPHAGRGHLRSTRFTLTRRWPTRSTTAWACSSGM